MRTVSALAESCDSNIVEFMTSAYAADTDMAVIVGDPAPEDVDKDSTDDATIAGTGSKCCIIIDVSI